MRHTLCFIAAMIVAAPLPAPLPAQRQQAGDPTTQVKGTGKLPNGWSMRFDPARSGAAPTPDQVVFAPTTAGYHVTSGPAAIYWATKDVGRGEFLVSATFTQHKSVGHEAYGIFIGGKNLADSTQSYTYFVIKPCRSRGDCKEPGAELGEILISQRTSDGRPIALVPITHDARVNADDPTDGHATNTLAIHVAKDSVHFILNDKLVRAIAKSQLNGLSTDGQTGIRVNHNIDVDIDWKGITK